MRLEVFLRCLHSGGLFFRFKRIKRCGFTRNNFGPFNQLLCLGYTGWVNWFEHFIKYFTSISFIVFLISSFVINLLSYFSFFSVRVKQIIFVLKRPLLALGKRLVNSFPPLNQRLFSFVHIWSDLIFGIGIIITLSRPFSHTADKWATFIDEVYCIIAFYVFNMGIYLSTSFISSCRENYFWFGVFFYQVEATGPRLIHFVFKYLRI
jgi:hypothetical protein